MSERDYHVDGTTGVAARDSPDLRNTRLAGLEWRVHRAHDAALEESIDNRHTNGVV